MSELVKIDSRKDDFERLANIAFKTYGMWVKCYMDSKTHAYLTDSYDDANTRNFVMQYKNGVVEMIKSDNDFCILIFEPRDEEKTLGFIRFNLLED